MATWTAKPKASRSVDEAYLKIDADDFLNIGGGNKLIIQAQQSGSIWSAKTREGS